MLKRAHLLDEPERVYQARIVRTARQLGWSLVYHPWRSDHSAAGWPDLALVRGNRLLLWEVKSERGQPTAEQWEWLAALQACTEVDCSLVRPSDWDSVIERLRP